MNKWQVISDKYIKNGLKIMPVRQNAKLPVLNAWNKECSCDYTQLVYWFEHNHNFNWGLPCFENNLFVIDLDRHDEQKDGVVYFEKLCKDLGIDYPQTMIQKTPSNGMHLIFQSNDILKDVNGVSNAFPNYPGIDLRNRNYIVVEPSVINGKEYKFLNDLPPMSMPIQLQQYIINTVGVKSEKKEPYVKPKQVECGDRDNQIFNYVSHLYRTTDLDMEEVETLALYFNENILEEPFEEKEVLYKVKKCFEKDRPERMLIFISADNKKDEI